MASVEITSGQFIPGTTADLESQIQTAEIALGIVTPGQRLREAVLLVDRYYLDAAAVTDPKNINPERALGHAEWLGHLAARRLTQEYGDQPLTLDFILAVHRAYVEPIAPGRAGTLLATGWYWFKGVPRDEMESGPGYHEPLTSRQVDVVQANPYLRFEPDVNSKAPNGGTVVFPNMTLKERVAALNGLCSWYNHKKKNLTYDRVLLAAQLERRGISIHALDSGVNGRPWRALMNWSLENAGLPPSAPVDFDNDILSTLSKWRSQVSEGMNEYARMGKLIVAGEVETATLLGQEQQKRFYEEVLCHRVGPPPSLTPGTYHDRAAYMDFATSVSVEWHVVEAQTS